MVKASKAPATGRAKTNPSVPTIVGGEQPLVAPQVQEMVAAPTVSLTLQTPATGQPTPTAAQQPAPTQTQPYPLLTVASRQSFVIPLADTLTPKLHAARSFGARAPPGTAMAPESMICSSCNLNLSLMFPVTLAGMLGAAAQVAIGAVFGKCLDCAIVVLGNAAA